MKKLSLLIFLAGFLSFAKATNYADYVNPLVGTQSTFELSTGNTYPAIARPWGMNFWSPQTGKMGDGWMYHEERHLQRAHHVQDQRAREDVT